MLARLENYITPDEFDRFLAVMPQVLQSSYKVNPLDLSMVARLQYGSGLRVTEALTLKREDFDLDKRLKPIWFDPEKGLDI